MEIPEAAIFVGVQGSGKTSYYRERFFNTHVRISLDVLRTRPREHILFTACLQARQSFVIDNTNPLARDRARYILQARAAGFRVDAYCFQTSLQDAIRRNNQRKLQQKIPAAAVAATFKKLEKPTLEEGFDRIFIVELNPEGQFVLCAEGAVD
jgi:predicted kinase